MSRTLCAVLVMAVLASACSSGTEPAPTTTTTAAAPAAPTVGEQLVARLSAERWDADCISLLDEALAVAQTVVDTADPLTHEQFAHQSETIIRDFDPLQADLAARFDELGCSQFWWDITLVDRSETLTSSSIAGFITRFSFLEASVSNIAQEYGPAVGLMVKPETPPVLPDEPERPTFSSCDDVFDALLTFQIYQVDLADHLATLPAAPPEGYDEFAAEYTAATQSFADENSCDPVAAAQHIIANEQLLDPNNVYGSFAKYVALGAALRQADFA